MARPDRPQLRFLGRASLLFAAALVVWWLVLLGPLLDWVRLASAVLLDAAGGFRTETSVTVRPDGVWVIQAPAPAQSETVRRLAGTGRVRSVKVEAAPGVPVLYTVSLPLYWAVILAAGRSRKLWRALALGSLLLLVLPPLGLLIYAAHVVQVHLYSHSPGAVGKLLDFADYLFGTVVPYTAPVFMALALHPEFRAMVLGSPSTSVKETGRAQRLPGPQRLAQNPPD